MVIVALFNWLGALSCDTFLGHLALDFQCVFPVCDSPVIEFVNFKMSKPECISDYNLSKFLYVSKTLPQSAVI